MGDIDRIYKLMGSALKRVYGYYVIRPLQRFNVDNRAENLIEKEIQIPRSAPRHEGTDQLFRQIAQKNPEIREKLSQKSEDLLKRLASVKVVSKQIELSEQEIQEMNEIREKVKNRLPQSREGTDVPIHAYIEPPFVPKGRTSLVRALDFIGKHSKSPEEYDSKTIAKQTDLKHEDVIDILEHFKPFYKDEITDPIEDTQSLLDYPRQQWADIKAYLKPKSFFKQKTQSSTNQESSTGSQNPQNNEREKDDKRI